MSGSLKKFTPFIFHTGKFYFVSYTLNTHNLDGIFHGYLYYI